MNQFKAKDGTIYEVPDNPTPEELEWLQQQGAEPYTQPSVWKDGLKSFLSGTLEGAARAPYIVGDLLNLGARGVNKIRPGTIPEQYEMLTSDRVMQLLMDEGGIYNHLPETTVGKYANTAGAALGGTAVFGGPRAFKLPAPSATLPGLGSKTKDIVGRILRTPGLTAPAVGLSAQAGTDLSGGNPVGGLAAGAGSQLAMALAGRMMTPNHPAWIRHGTEGMGPDDWTNSQKNLDDLRVAGAKQHTLADTMPETSRLRPMTADLSNTSGGQRLGELLAARNNPGTQQLAPNGQLIREGAGDIPRLLDEASDVIGPAPNAGAVQQQLATNSAKLLQLAREGRTNELLATLRQSPPIDRAEVAALIQKLRAKVVGNPEISTAERAAYNEAISALQKQDFRRPTQTSGLGLQPQAYPRNAWETNLVALSKNVKDLKKGVPPVGSAPGKTANMQAYKMADEALKQTNEFYSKAMQDYLNTTRNTVDPMKRGLVGQFADLVDDPSRQGSINTVLKNAPPQEIQQNLGKVANTPDLRRDLARVIADQNKQPVKVAGSAQEAIDKGRQTVVDLIDKPATKSAYAAKTKAADTLSRLTAEAGADATARQNLGNSWISKILAPIYEMRVRMNLRLSEKEARTLAELIGNPTDANLALLKKIAQERPDLDNAIRQMGRMGAVQGAGTSSLIEE